MYLPTILSYSKPRPAQKEERKENHLKLSDNNNTVYKTVLTVFWRLLHSGNNKSLIALKKTASELPWFK
jgi:hypothetical protein